MVNELIKLYSMDKGEYRMKKIAIIALLGLIMFRMFDTSLNVIHYTIEDDRVKDAIKIAHISDLHSCDYGENQVTLTTAIDEEAPDIIVLTGDIFDDEMPHEKSMELIDYIGEKYPCYYVTGNHELWSRQSTWIKERVREAGITVLAGSGETITIGESVINIVGVDDSDISKYRGGQTLASQLRDGAEIMYNNHYTVLLAHRPYLIDMYLKYGYDLVLSGHAHGGQWRIPFLLNGLLAPNEGLFPKYAGGLYEIGTKKMIVSRGLALESTRVPRIFNPPELVIINLE